MAKHTLTPAAWIEAGLAQLTTEGPQALRAEPLARYLKTTKGSFYWHFKDVPAFHDAVLAHWKDGALTAAAALKDADGSAAERLIQLGQTVQNDSADAALRAWGQSNPLVEQSVADVDAVRMAQLGALLTEMGTSNDDFAKAAYGALVGLRQMKMDDGDALVAYASLIDLVLALQ